MGDRFGEKSDLDMSRNGTFDYSIFTKTKLLSRKKPTRCTFSKASADEYLIQDSLLVTLVDDMLFFKRMM